MHEPTALTPRARLGAFLVTLGVAAVLMGFIVPGIGATNTDPHQVTICHATRSVSNPYSLITVDVAAVLQQGHSGHDGAAFDPNVPADRWGDIIPPFDYGPDAQYLGKNWTAASEAILANDCSPSIPTTTTTGPPGA
jgi:hypothetical protein